jgi:hypothetical protein
MSKISQRQSVENAAQTHFGDRFQAGVDIETYATKEDQRAIATLVAQGMLEGTVELSESASAKYATSGLEFLTKKYVMGMVKNWFDKSPSLNGNTKHVIKNPGSRAGSTDATVKTLRDMIKLNANDAEAVARIQVQLDAKLAEIKASKPAKAAKEIKIDSNLVPAELQDLLDQAV